MDATAKPAAAAATPAQGREQQFAISHLTGDEDFKSDGLRPYARYRDLGFAPATGGMVHAQVIRLQAPCTDEVRKRHAHLVDFQMVYVLKGWMRIEFDGQGEKLMKAGDSALMPPGIKHTVLDYSDDCENLEIVMPAEFETV